MQSEFEDFLLFFQAHYFRTCQLSNICCFSPLLQTFSRRGCYLLISHIKIHMNANDMYIGALHPPTKDTIHTIALIAKPTLYNFFIGYCSIVMNSGKGCSFFSTLTASFSFAPAVTSATVFGSDFSSIAGGSDTTNSSQFAFASISC